MFSGEAESGQSRLYWRGISRFRLDKDKRNKTREGGAGSDVA
jgi:hypothetical protein